MPIAHCFAEHRNKNSHQFIDDEQLASKLLLTIGQQVMLTANLWVQAGLVNGFMNVKVVDRLT